MTSLLLRALTFPHGVEGYRDAFRPPAAAGNVAAEVVAITTRTPRARSILLRPERPLPFVAGQHLLVTCVVDGVRLTRCYSLSDTPHRADGLLEITVAHIPEGRVSGHLVQRARIGEVVGLSVPQGEDFTLPAIRPDRVLLVGGGSGITPLRSIWRTMAAEGLADRVAVLYSARTAADVPFADELADIGATVVLTRDGGQRIDAERLAALPTPTMAYTCGPAGLVQLVAAHLGDRGVDVRTESFAPPVPPADPTGAGGVLTFARSGASAHDDGRSLLEQAEAAGLTPPHGCRMGICRTCTTTKHAGVVRDLRTGATSDDGTEEVQLCITTPVGDVQLDL